MAIGTWTLHRAGDQKLLACDEDGDYRIANDGDSSVEVVVEVGPVQLADAGAPRVHASHTLRAGESIELRLSAAVLRIRSTGGDDCRGTVERLGGVD